MPYTEEDSPVTDDAGIDFDAILTETAQRVEALRQAWESAETDAPA